MMPVLFTIPGIDYDIPSYGFMMMIGFLAAIMWAAKRAERSGANPDVVLNCGFVALIGGVAGARAMFVAHYWERFANQPNTLDMVFAIINVTQGGLEFYGGFVAAVIAVFGYLYFWKHSVRWYFDMMAPSAMIGLGFGRIGCFLNGCCWGGVCAMPWAVTFPYASPPQFQHWQANEPAAALPAELIYTTPLGVPTPISRESMRAVPADIDAAQQNETQLAQQVAQLEERLAAAQGETREKLERELKWARLKQRSAQAAFRDVRAQMEKFDLDLPALKAKAAAHRSLPVHPAQLYEAIAAFLLAMLLSTLYWRRKWDGQVLSVLLIVQPLARICLETIRTDNPHDTFGLTISQGIGLGLTLAGVLLYLTLRRLPARSPRAKRWEPPAAEAGAATT